MYNSGFLIKIINTIFNKLLLLYIYDGVIIYIYDHIIVYNLKLLYDHIIKYTSTLIIILIFILINFMYSMVYIYYRMV
jgi:hypothetical protein